MLNELKRAVCKANKELASMGLAKFTWGNVSGFDPSMGLFVIKPSGVPFAGLQPELMVVMSLEGQRVEGRLKPSSDAETHRALYLSWAARPDAPVGAIVHTHSMYATAYAQAGMPIPALGTTHADTFYGDIPVTRPMTKTEIEGDYEYNTGRVIAETVSDPARCAGALVFSHGVFAWGKEPVEAVYNAVVIEEAAQMAYITTRLNPGAGAIDKSLLNRHFFRKHGPDAYYGQQT